MKIGLITGEYPPMEGGVGAFTQELAKALSAHHHEVHIITSRLARPVSSQQRVRDLLEPVQQAEGWIHPIIRQWKWNSWSEIADVVLRYELDVVNIQYQASAFDMRHPAINLLPWRLRGLAKTAVTFHDLRTPYLFPKAGRLRHWAVHTMARQAHGAIVTNTQDYNTLQQVMGQATLSQIPIGSNITAYQPDQSEIDAVYSQLGVSAQTPLLGYFGFLNETKGADTLISALAQIEGAHLVFIGGQTGSSDPDNNGQFLQTLQTQIAQLGVSDRVHWTGFVADQQVSTYLHACDLMVMPYRDGVSLRRGTLMAVLAHGRPLITTYPQTPIPDIEQGKQMLLTEPDDVLGLVDAIQQLLVDNQQRQQLGQGGQKLAENFTWDKIAEQTAVFYKTL